MAETLLQKAQRLGIQPSVASTGESLLEKAQKLGIQPALQVKEPNYFQRVGESFTKTGEQITGSIQKGAETYTAETDKGNVFKATGGLLRSGLRTVGGVAEAAFAPIFEIPVIKGTIEKIGQKVLGVSKIQEFVTEATKLAERYPDQATDIKNIVDILTLGGGKTVEKPLLQEGKLIAKDITGSTRAALLPSEEMVQKNIVEMFNKSIKPTAKKTIAQGQKYENDTLNALKTIKANANDLNIEDAMGEIVTGRTPQSLNELAQAVDQTKKLVFTQYDNLAKQAGTVGVTIDAKPIADEVLKVSQNKALQITNPEVVKYAEQWAERLRGLDVLDTETTQAVIQNLNNNLQAFYKNPTYEAASKVAVDAGVVNNFRKSLDDAIEGATGEQYQVLKKQYGALKAIENDVTRAAMRDGRKNVKGLLDYSDMFTSGQMLGGILSLNPAMFTKGAVERGFKEYFKFLNDPNRAIENIFENLNIKTGEKFIPQSTIGKYIANPKLGMSIEDVTKGKSGNLLSEARKYKTAEEFVKAQGNPLLHGTEKKFKDFDISKMGMNEKDIPARNSFFFTDSLDTAKSYGKNIQERYGSFKKPMTIDADGKMYGDMREELREAVLKAKKDGNDVVIIKNLSDRKDWGNYEPATHYAVLDLNSLKTKSQLTDIWNTANKASGESALMAEAKKYKSAEEFVKAQGTLPEPIKKVKTFTTEEGVFSKYSFGDNQRYDITVHEGKNGFTVRNIILPEIEQGKGLGTKIYRALNEQSLAKTGKPLMSTKPREITLSSGKTENFWELSDRAKLLWDSLVRKGEAIKNADGTYQFKTKSQLTDIWKRANKK